MFEFEGKSVHYVRVNIVSFSDIHQLKSNIMCGHNIFFNFIT